MSNDEQIQFPDSFVQFARRHAGWTLDDVNAALNDPQTELSYADLTLWLEEGLVSSEPCYGRIITGLLAMLPWGTRLWLEVKLDELLGAHEYQFVLTEKGHELFKAK